MNVYERAGALVVELEREHRCLSSAVLGGGLGSIRTWFNLSVAPDYARTDPAAHLAESTAGLPGPIVGMLTAVDVRSYTCGEAPLAEAISTVGLSHALAAAGRRPHALAAPGTINTLVVVRAALCDAALAGGLQTAVEAKAQALADAGIPARNAPGAATGTPTDSICLACLPGEGEEFAGPATAVGADLARAVHQAVLAGAAADRSARRRKSA